MECKDKTAACSGNEMVSKRKIKEECCWLEGTVKSEFEESSILDAGQQNRNKIMRTENKVESWEPDTVLKAIKYEPKEFSNSYDNNQNEAIVFGESKNNISHKITEIKIEPLWCKNTSTEVKPESEEPALHDHQENGTGVAMNSETETLVHAVDQEMNIKIEIKEEPWGMENIHTETVLPEALPDIQHDTQMVPCSASRTTTEDLSSAGSTVLHTEELDKNGSDFSTPVSASLEERDPIYSSDSSTNKINDVLVNKASPVEISNMVQSRKEHKCDVCLKSFPTPWRLKRHHFVHEGKRPHKCEACGKCFIENSDLQRHYEVHRGKKPHNCEICAFFTHFKEHTMSHVKNLPEKCAVCEKSSTLLSALERHGLLHGNEGTYTCKSCCKSFSLE